MLPYLSVHSLFMNDRLLELIGKKQAGELSPSELIELNKLIQGNPAYADLLKTLESIWDTPLHTEQELTEAHVRDRWNKIRERREDETAPVSGGRVVRRMIRYAAAACVIVLAGIGVWWVSGRRTAGDDHGHNNVVATKNGSHSRVTLPDGTEVWLNAGSNLTYDEAFGKETREVHLVGEAFFDVAKDAAHPFVIHTKTINIKVLGTTFNIRAYPDEPVTEASLIKGSIEISLRGRPSDRIQLRPDEKIAVRNDEPSLYARKDSVASEHISPAIMLSKVAYVPGDSMAVETSWVKNKLIFRDKPFDELTKDLERWYNVSFIIKNKDLPSKRFTGTFYNESIQEALNKLKVSYPFQYSYDKKSNIITIE